MTRYQILALLGVAGGFMAGTRYQSSKHTTPQNHQAITQLTQIVGTAPAISIQTQSFGSESSWEVTQSGEVICSGSGYNSNTLYQIDDCQLSNGDYSVKCIDSYGDGWHGAYVTIGQNQFCEDFTNGTLQTEDFSVAQQSSIPETSAPAMSIQTQAYGSEISWDITQSTEVICSGSGYASNTQYQIDDCELSEGDYTLSCIDSFGDGWHGAYITIGTNQYCGDFTNSNGNDGSLMTLNFSIDSQSSSNVYPEYQVEMTNAAFSTPGNWDQSRSGVCDASPDRVFTAEQDLSYEGNWIENEPCACAHTAGTESGQEWSAFFNDGEALVTKIQFLGRNSNFQQSDNLEIFIGETSCGITADSADEEWTTYFCNVPVYSNKITLKQGNDGQYLSFCGIKVFAMSIIDSTV